MFAVSRISDNIVTASAAMPRMERLRSCNAALAQSHCRCRLSNAIWLLAAALLLSGCGASFVAPEFSGRISPLTEPVQIAYAPAGSYSVESITDTRVTAAGLNFADGSYQTVDSATARAEFAGQASVTPAAAGYAWELVYDKAKLETKGKDGNEVFVAKSQPALRIALTTDWTGAPQSVDLGADSTFLKELPPQQRAQIRQSVDEMAKTLAKHLVPLESLSAGGPVEVDPREMFSDMIEKQPSPPDVSGTLVMTPVGTTELNGRVHLVAEIEGNIELKVKGAESAIKTGGYQLIDTASGLNSLVRLNSFVETKNMLVRIRIHIEQTVTMASLPEQAAAKSYYAELVTPWGAATRVPWLECVDLETGENYPSTFRCYPGGKIAGPVPSELGDYVFHRCLDEANIAVYGSYGSPSPDWVHCIAGHESLTEAEYKDWKKKHADE